MCVVKQSNDPLVTLPLAPPPPWSRHQDREERAQDKKPRVEGKVGAPFTGNGRWPVTRAGRAVVRAETEAAVAYVRFAVTHPAHFSVMFRPDLLHGDHPELTAARRESRTVLQGGSAEASSAEAGSAGAEAAAIAAWSLVHGLAILHLTANLPPGADLEHLETLTRAAATRLFPRT